MAFQSSAFFSLPSAELFSFPPSTDPAFVTPPPPNSIPFAPPFAIPDHVYQAVLPAKVPLTIAALYAVTAKLLNAYNKSTGKKPWGISKTKTFKAFVIAHNVFLAVYSAWTFWGMLGTLRRSMVSPLGPHGLAGFADSVCQLNGPGGLGNAVFYNQETESWQSYSPYAGFEKDGYPSKLDTGRIWNEGLAFYGWIFYLSKFYEVLDTFIILAKGKFSSTLQTYHHAGAMMCMWAGMRYMSAPIWMFVFVNSGIHAMMYTYYTVTAFNIRVPMLIKRSLTTMQITQFLVGASYAMAHSFVSYYVPAIVEVDEKAASDSASAAVNGTTAAIIDGARAYLFGSVTRLTGADGAPSEVVSSVDAARSVSGRQAVPCVTGSAQTFAIWLNVLYLAPLTYLFVSFFINSYLRQSNAADKQAARNGPTARRLSNNVVMAEKAGWEAAKNVEREVYGQGSEQAIESDEGAAVRRGKANGKANGRTLRSRP
ncbi:fatty acid elongase-like protein [Apodospora peruviana]|uniref:Elongation of fatty acids protein n=1 Tax=Apodospora peruviana TaxID=516989 RepID=A0AAE0LZM3_9PEZI|nr:fatty acid elongase-like protein [Apodospora peruviana]